MSDLKKQKEKTDGKGWGVVDFSRESPFKVVKDVASKVIDTVIPRTLKKVSEKIQKIKDKKKRGPRDE